MKIKPLKSFNKTLSKIASDKSISHRFAIFSLLCAKKSVARNYLLAEDTLNTLEIIRNLGAKVERKGSEVSITPPKEITSPNCVLDCGNSGTAMRLFMGLLAGIHKGFFVLSGDKYLNNRPMKRVSAPLSKLGAKIYGRFGGELAPLAIEGARLEGFDYQSPIASAQVKTALILAGLKAKQKSYFSEPNLSRNHSENMLLYMGAPLKILNASKNLNAKNSAKNAENLKALNSKNSLNSTNSYAIKLEISPLKEPLKPLNIDIANDASSCFYFALAAVILPNSKVVLKNVLLNETRIEAFKVLQKMGAKIDFKVTSNTYEEIGEISAQSSDLKAVKISENIAWLIDEAPALAIAFALARGTSELRNAKELRVKESDRIKVVVANLKKCGVKARELEDGFQITGGAVKSAQIQSHGDHRIAMSFAILGLVCGMSIDDTACIKTSFPNFIKLLKQIGASIDY